MIYLLINNRHKDKNKTIVFKNVLSMSYLDKLVTNNIILCKKQIFHNILLLILRNLNH